MQSYWKPLSAVLGAAIVAGAITGLPGISSDEAVATPAIKVTKAPLSQISSDRGWPYAQRADKVRLIAVDRLH